MLQARIGRIALKELSADHVHEALEQLVQQHSRYYASYDADCKPVLISKRRPVLHATINRYAASLAQC